MFEFLGSSLAVEVNMTLISESALEYESCLAKYKQSIKKHENVVRNNESSSKELRNICFLCQ